MKKYLTLILSLIISLSVYADNWHGADFTNDYSTFCNIVNSNAPRKAAIQVSERFPFQSDSTVMLRYDFHSVGNVDVQRLRNAVINSLKNTSLSISLEHNKVVAVGEHFNVNRIGQNKCVTYLSISESISIEYSECSVTVTARIGNIVSSNGRYKNEFTNSVTMRPLSLLTINTNKKFYSATYINSYKELFDLINSLYTQLNKM